MPNHRSRKPAVGTLGNRIRTARKNKRLTLETVGKAVGVSAQAVGQWELNEAQPETSRLRRLANILEIEIDALLADNSSVGSAAAHVEKTNVRLTAPLQLRIITDPQLPGAYLIVNGGGQILGRIILFG